MEGKIRAEQLHSELEGKSILEKIEFPVKNYPGKVVFTTSFGYEDQVITDMIFRNDLPVEVITIDTARMFEETYKVFRSTGKIWQNHKSLFSANSRS